MGTSILDAEHDLSYRPKVGDSGFYRRRTTYRLLDERGCHAGGQEFCGDFRRVVEAVDPELVETITWRNVTRRDAGPDGVFGDPERLSFAEGFTYPFRLEEGYRDFDQSLLDDVPRDLCGWFFVLLLRDTQAPFDILRSHRHGIEKLRRIGDSVVEARDDSGEPPGLSLPGFLEVRSFPVTNMVTTFAGLTVRSGEPCALLTFDYQPTVFEFDMGETHTVGGSSFAGTLTLRLSDGAHEHAELVEYVFMPDMMNHNPIYEMWRIDESDYEAGALR